MENVKNIRFLKINNIILSLYCFSIVAGMLKNSTFGHSHFFSYLYLCSVTIMLIISLFLQKHTYYEFIVLIIGVLLTIANAFKDSSTFKYYLYIVIILFCMSTISPRKIIKYSAITMFICLFMITSASLLHIISDNITFRYGIARHSLGTNYALTFGSYAFFLTAAAYVLYKKVKIKSNFYMGICFIFVAWLVNKVTGSRNFSIAMFILGILLIMNNFVIKYVKKNTLEFLTCITFGISIISIFITKIVPYYSDIYQKLNILLNGRLGIQYDLFRYYSPKLMGQYIYQVTEKYASFYFFIDNSYTRLLFVAGILFTIFYFIILGISFHKMIRLGLTQICLVFIIMMITGIVQGSAISPEANIFLPLICVRKELFKKDFLEE